MRRRRRSDERPVTSAILHADWPQPPGVHACTTLRHGAGVSQPPFDSFNMGMRCGGDTDAVIANRQLLVELAALPSQPHWLRQVHGVDVVRFDAAPASANAWEQAQADASVTATRGTVLAVLTADCLPVVFAAADGSEIAAAHAGWRGLAGGVLEATIAAMKTSPENIVAWLGPAAGPDAYEIGEDVFTAFKSRDARSAIAFAATRRGHWRIDLYALARMQLQDLGVTHISGGVGCTISDPGRFYSHRRDGLTGRMATVVWMSP